MQWSKSGWDERLSVWHHLVAIKKNNCKNVWGVVDILDLASVSFTMSPKHYILSLS